MSVLNYDGGFFNRPPKDYSELVLRLFTLAIYADSVKDFGLPEEYKISRNVGQDHAQVEFGSRLRIYVSTNAATVKFRCGQQYVNFEDYNIYLVHGLRHKLQKIWDDYLESKLIPIDMAGVTGELKKILELLENGKSENKAEQEKA